MLHERLQPLADTATEVIYQGENCIVAYGYLIAAGMGVRFEIVAGGTQWGVGMRLVDVIGKIDVAARAACEHLKDKLADEQPATADEINAGAEALAAWVPFSQMAVTPPLAN